MSKFLRAVIVAASFGTVAGCAHVLAMSSTSMTSIPAPDLHGRTFHSILVVAQIGDLGLRLAMEDRFAAWAAKHDSEYVHRAPGSVSVRGQCTFTPAQVERARSDAAMTDSLNAACARSLAARSATAPSDSSEPQGPTQFLPSHTVLFPGRDYSSEQVVEVMHQYGIDATLVITPGEAGSEQYYVPPTYTTRCTGYNLNYGCAKTTTSSVGGFSYSKPWAQFSAKLFEAQDGVGVWIATATSGGNAFAQSADLLQSMADKTLERLLADGVVR